MPGMLEGIRNRLRSAEADEDRTASVPDPSADQAAPARGREIEFAAYAEACRIFGFLQITADRLSDALNETDEYRLVDVMVAQLADGRTTLSKALDVRRDELLAVRASGPRGDPSRRSRRRPYPMTLQTGPYLIHGYVHGFPGADPVAAVRRGRSFVPLTEAWIEYCAGGETHRARVGTIIVNRELLDWIRMSRDEEVRLPDLPAESKPDPRAKDLTGYIRTDAG